MRAYRHKDFYYEKYNRCRIGGSMYIYDVYRCHNLDIRTPVDDYVGSVHVQSPNTDVRSVVISQYGVTYTYEVRRRLQATDYTYRRNAVGMWEVQSQTLMPFRAERCTKRLAEAAARVHRDNFRALRSLPAVMYERGFAMRFKPM